MTTVLVVDGGVPKLLAFFYHLKISHEMTSLITDDKISEWI